MSKPTERSVLTTHQKSFGRRLIVSFVVFNCLLVSFALMTLGINYVRSEREARVVTRNISQVLDQSLTGAIREVDLGLLAVKNEFEANRRLRRFDIETMNAYIERQRQYLPQLDSLRIADERGLICLGTGVEASGRISIADRDYFMRLRDDPSADLVFSKPLVGRISQKWSVIFARRLNQENGEFAGVVYGPILLDTLQNRFTAIDLGRQSVISLRNERLELIARSPALGRPEEMFVRGRAAAELVSPFKAGEVESTQLVRAGNDNVIRIVTRRKIARYPLYVFVGMSQTEYLKNWRYDVIRVVILTLLSITVTTIFGLFIQRSRQRERDASEHLAKEREKYRIVADNTLDWEYWLAQDGSVVYCSPSCVSMTGRVAAAFYADPTLFSAIIYPDDRDKHEKMRQAIVSTGGEPTHDVFRILHADGSVRWLESACRAVVDDAGAALGVRGSNRDITTRKKIEEDRRYLTDIVERSLNEIYVCNVVTFGFEHVNQGALKNMRASLDEIRKVTLLDVQPSLTRASFEQMIQPLLDGSQDVLVYETLHQRRDRTTYPVEVHLQLVEGRGSLSFLAIAFDITARKQAESAREEAMTRVRTLEGIIPICMYCKKIRDTENSWNQLEKYITEHSEAMFSHGICPRCLETHRDEYE
jgi:PAS domain S-box-containing protein